MSVAMTSQRRRSMPLALGLSMDAQKQGGGGSAPVLGNISVSPNTATVGTPYNGTSSGRTPSSTLSLSGAGSAGLSIDNTTGAITGTPTASGAVNVVETLAGATGSPKTSSGVVTVAYDASIIFFDDPAINPDSGLLSNRTPLVAGDPAFPGHYPSSNGSPPGGANDAASKMNITGGVMKQTVATPGYAGYDNVLLPENPGLLSTEFIWSTGGQPAVMGVYPYAGSGAPTLNAATVKLIHLFMTTTSLAPQLGDYTYFPNGSANYPMAWPGPASPFTLTVGQKYTLQAKIQGKWVFMELFNSSGTSIAKAQAYDSRVPLLFGRAAFLAETFDTLMGYGKERVLKASAFTVPTIAPAIDSYFPSGLDGLTGSMYSGGGVAWNSAGNVTITANATLGSGAAIPIGAVAVGDKVRVCVDTISIGANPIVACIAPTSPGTPISPYQPPPTLISAAGRSVLDITATGADANSSLVIGGNGAGATTAVIKGLFVLKNGPTALL